VRYRSRHFLQNTQEMILDCGNNVRLLGYYNSHSDKDKDAELNTNKPKKSLVILLHGWEGDSESTYVLSASKRLFDQGHDIFRLNFRDHGNSLHLNRELFNSTRLSDVTGAMVAIQKQLKYDNYFLAGFSLGGNFTLRTTIAQTEHDYRIDRAVAVCPLICPNDTMNALASGLSFYEQYFVKKWKRTLADKTKHFPEYDYTDKLKDLKTLKHVNELFIPGYTPFDNSETYFDAYHLKDKRLEKITSPTTIITSLDDPIVRHHMLPRENLSDKLSLEITQYGSHCAYLKNYRLHSWADDRLEQLFQL
jgi:predicted alpha/beta-fold hydrolase